MGGIRPSGLHINKPAVIALAVLFFGCIFVYKYVWGTSAVSQPLKEESVKTLVEDSPKSLNAVPVDGKESDQSQPVIWNAKELVDPPDLNSEMKAKIKRFPNMLEISIDGKKYQNYLEETVLQGTSHTQSVLFLHGAKFTSKNWIDIDVLDHVASWGFKAIAVDLPGHGKTADNIDDSVIGSYLPALIAALRIEKPIIVSPSMSGKYSLPFLFGDPEKSTEKATGFVPIAPGSVQAYENSFAKSQLPTLVVFGTKDISNGVAFMPTFQRLPKSITAPISEADHACYLDDPKTFIKYLYSFLRKLKA